jgi:hypothetical protein
MSGKGFENEVYPEIDFGKGFSFATGFMERHILNRIRHWLPENDKEA